MSEDSQVLEEVVVVGYGFMKRKDITTAVSVVSTADIEERPIMTAAQAIQGKAPVFRLYSRRVCRVPE